MSTPTPQEPGQQWRREGAELVWHRTYGPWLVTAHCPVAAPFTGPSELSIRLTVGGSGEEITRAMAEALETDGIPASLLRQIPLAEIKAGARAALAQQGDRAMNTPYPVPARCRTEEDYALLVGELTRMHATGTTAPQGELAARLGISKGTMSDRIRRAKEMGLWDGGLTEKASAVLAAWRNHNDEEGN
ncbi:winged helix-turn-helix domain-containing protein [Streptomyces sp. NPDC048057]|uniref:winged helix-turn-helix domain-containing protein n=1 Tax=Streptomyces sp. NPDC048057 TaxID=3155628 RepID=UPI0033C462FD